MDNLIIFVDNCTFKLNNIIISYIKRFIIYEIIANKYLNEKSNIHLYKTYRKIVGYNHINNNSEQIEMLLDFVNNIIYKKYDDVYPSICFKHILDEVDNLCENISKTKIIIITSIDTEKRFSESNISYISEKFNIYNSSINIVNISKYNIFNKFSSINRYYIDINTIKPYNHINNTVFSSIFEHEKKIFNDLNNNNICVGIFNYLSVLSYIDKNIVNNKNIVNEKNFKYVISLYENLNLNKTTYNYIFSIQKNMLNLLTSLEDFNIKIPINKLNTTLKNTNIQNILEFYELIYPKLFNNCLIIRKFNDILTKVKYETSAIAYNHIIFDSLNIYNSSSDYLTSSLTLSNWLEDYQNYNPFGILIKYFPNKYSYKGIIDLNSNIIVTYPSMDIVNISENWIGVYDYYHIILNQYETIISDYDDNFDIENFNISDNFKGDTNIFLPIYINKHHWKLVKSIWTYHMSFIFNSFEFEYNKKMDNLYFYVILKYSQTLFNTTNNNSICFFCYLLRTCIQIIIDNRYIKNITTYYMSSYNKVMLLNNTNNPVVSNYIIHLLQIIIFNNISEETLIEHLTNIKNHIIKLYIEYYYEHCISFEEIKKSNDRELEIEELRKNILKNIAWFKLEYDLIKLYKLVSKIYSTFGFNQFIKKLDSTNGYLGDILNTEYYTLFFENISNIENKFDIEKVEFMMPNFDI